MKPYNRLNLQEKNDFIKQADAYLKTRNNYLMCKTKATQASFAREPVPKDLFNFERYVHSNWRWYFEKIKLMKFEKEIPLWEQSMYPWKYFK